MNRLLLLPLFFCSLTVSAGSGYIVARDTTPLYFVNDNEIYSADKDQLLYFNKGNIFFKGGTDDRQNILLMASSMVPTGKELQLLYEKDNEEPVYSFTKDRFYLGETHSADMRERNEMLHIERSKKFMAFYASWNDSLLAYYKIADSLPSSTAIILDYTHIKKFGLEKKTMAQMAKPLFENQYSDLKPAAGNTTANEWIWDGKVLRLRWDVDEKYMWTFDGQTIKQYGNNSYFQYSWDGQNFKPLSRTDESQEWNWDGKVIKPASVNDYTNQYMVADGMVKPWSDTNIAREWRLDGDIPVPLIILVISGLAKAED